MSFDFLGLSTEVLQAVDEAGYTEPTPIQKQAIPTVLMGRDVLGIAQTGTGKTASFVLPMLDILSQGRARARMPRSLILEPTRELAAQVSDSFVKYGKHSKLSMALLIGGVSFDEQKKKLDRGVDVLVATPGRLLDHFERGRLMLTGVEILVIDEADRMLDMGFIPDVERIRSLVPTKPQILFFSATMPNEIRRLSKRFLKDPKEVAVAKPATTVENVSQHLVIVPRRSKEKTLKALIKAEDIVNAIIFCNRKRDVDVLSKALKGTGYTVAALHGDMDQYQRMDVLATFKSGDLSILVASDVAARGLDIPAVSHVFNYDVPLQAEDYVHRIGRTGRAGRPGAALTIAAPDDGRLVSAITNLIGKELEILAAADIGTVDFDEEGADRRGRRGNRRGPTAGPAKKPSPRKKSPAPKDEGAKADAPASPEVAEKPAAPVPETASKPASEPAPEPTKEPASEPAPEVAKKPAKKPAKRPSRRSRPRRLPDLPDGGAGLGDNIPAFIQRTVNRKPSEDG